MSFTPGSVEMKYIELNLDRIVQRNVLLRIVFFLNKPDLKHTKLRAADAAGNSQVSQERI